MASHRSTTPPLPEPETSGTKSPLTPEQVRRIEINRLKAKALRQQREADLAPSAASSHATLASNKRSFAAFSTGTPTSNRDAKKDQASERPLDAIQPARNFAKYVEYDFSRMTDTRGGFLAEEDEPHQKRADEDTRPSSMTLKEWERQQLLRSLKSRKAGPFEPGISAISAEDQGRRCRECASLEIDWKWEETLKCAVCNPCKEKFPEKYSLLTKTEAKDDYLLTDRECQSYFPDAYDIF